MTYSALLAFFNIRWSSWCLLRQLVPENVKSLQKQCFLNSELNLTTNSQCDFGSGGSIVVIWNPVRLNSNLLLMLISGINIQLLCGVSIELSWEMETFFLFPGLASIDVSLDLLCLTFNASPDLRQNP